METKKEEVKQEVIDPVDATTLENLIGEIKLESEPKKRGRKPKVAEQAPAPDENELLIDCIIDMSDQYFVSAGLKPINLLQKMILRVGLTGTVKKYGLSISEYPEIVLLSGVIWIGVDKYTELEAKKVKKTDEKGAQK